MICTVYIIFCMCAIRLRNILFSIGLAIDIRVSRSRDLGFKFRVGLKIVVVGFSNYRNT